MGIFFLLFHFREKILAKIYFWRQDRPDDLDALVEAENSVHYRRNCGISQAGAYGQLVGKKDDELSDLDEEDEIIISQCMAKESMARKIDDFFCNTSVQN